jgi:hypothetical protein
MDLSPNYGKSKSTNSPTTPIPLKERKTWTIQSDWEHLRLLGNRINFLSNGWSFWHEEN